MNLDSVETLEQKETSSFEILNQQTTLRESVELAMKNYFAQLEDEKPADIYNLVLAEVEAPLMESVMAYTQGNQTKASQVLGLNRGTLRKKLKMYGLN
ncbi:DNA-binding transcriptional regulator Fis [Aliikangiella sp. IMCC44359]|uniref:DNA-binding transcriptional regulator Fis n=1 Tax=Aliikangiella sp. IMCC44359 TaxID=3459125 RepID=UPI00403AC8CE